MFLTFFLQVRWVQPAGSAIRRHEALTVVRSCAVGGATTPPESSRLQSVNASSNGVAPWSARTARRLWTYTHARPQNEPNGWTRPEDTPPSPQLRNPTPYTLCRTFNGTWDSRKVCPKSAVHLRPPHLLCQFVTAWL